MGKLKLNPKLSYGLGHIVLFFFVCVCVHINEHTDAD